MTEKEMKNLSKLQLLGLLRDQEVEIEQLTSESGMLKAQLRKQQTEMQSMGAVTETAMDMTTLMHAAQRSADVYLENIRKMEEASRIKTEQLEELVRQRVETMLRENEQKCAVAEAQQKQAVDDLWVEFQQRLSQYASVFSALQEAIKRSAYELQYTTDLGETVKHDGSGTGSRQATVASTY